jgi:hypothetical protein
LAVDAKLKEGLPYKIMHIMRLFWGVEAFRFLDVAESTGAGGVPDLITSTTIPDVIISEIDRLEPAELHGPMLDACFEHSLEGVKLLYDKGYNYLLLDEGQEEADPGDHPACLPPSPAGWRACDSWWNAAGALRGHCWTARKLCRGA